MRRGLALLVLLGVVSGAWAGVLSPVSGPADLDLSGTIYYAVNCGGTSDQVVAKRWFESDNDGDALPVGYTTNASEIYTTGWGYGTVTDPALQAVYNSMRYLSPGPVNLTLPNLPPGKQVKVQVLLSEGYDNASMRIYDVIIEGNTEFPAVDPWTLWGYKQPGVATTTVTVSNDGVLNVALQQTLTAPDKNPVIDGIIVSDPSLPRAGMNYSSAKKVTSAADLDLASPVHYAINVGGSESPVVSGITFRSDTTPIPGYTVNSTTIAQNWGVPSIADPNLYEVYDDIRYTGGAGVQQTFANLPPNSAVKVQVLLSENFWTTPGHRPLNIAMEGQPKWSALDPVALWGASGPGVLTTWAHVGADGVLNTQISGIAGYDTNAIVNGIIVSSPGNKVPLTGASVTASATYDANFPASNVVDGSTVEWTGSRFDYWLLPSGATGYLTFDLGDNWNLQFVELHNTDNYIYHDRGTVAYHIAISPDATFTRAEVIAAGDLQTYDQGWYFLPVSTDKYWRYARFYVDSFSGTQLASGGGLSEIGFYGVTPEPTSLTLLGLGALGLLARRRRRA